jgi:hypothetical protein
LVMAIGGVVILFCVLLRLYLQGIIVIDTRLKSV